MLVFCGAHPGQAQARMEPAGCPSRRSTLPKKSGNLYGPWQNPKCEKPLSFWSKVMPNSCEAMHFIACSEGRTVNNLLLRCGGKSPEREAGGGIAHCQVTCLAYANDLRILRPPVSVDNRLCPKCTSKVYLGPWLKLPDGGVPIQTRTIASHPFPFGSAGLAPPERGGRNSEPLANSS